MFNPQYPSNLFLSRKYCLLFTTTAYIQVNFGLDFIMEANTMNTDQTAPFSWVHIVCNIVYLLRKSADKRADNKRRDKLEKC